jgi:hypothetical protein
MVRTWLIVVGAIALTAELLGFLALIFLFGQFAFATWNWMTAGNFEAAGFSEMFPRLAGLARSSLPDLVPQSLMEGVLQTWWSGPIAAFSLSISGCFGALYYATGGRLGK